MIQPIQQLRIRNIQRNYIGTPPLEEITNLKFILDTQNMVSPIDFWDEELKQNTDQRKVPPNKADNVLKWNF